MKQKKGLGSVPRGLQWIEDIVQTAQIETPKVIEAPIQAKPVETAPAEIPKEHHTIKTSQEGLTAGWTRATFIVKEEYLEKLKALAYWERLTLKEVVADALEHYLQDKNIKPVIKAKKITG